MGTFFLKNDKNLIIIQKFNDFPVWGVKKVAKKRVPILFLKNLRKALKSLLKNPKQIEEKFPSNGILFSNHLNISKASPQGILYSSYSIDFISLK